MKFLIAGYGSIGRRHMRNLLALGQDEIILYHSRQSTLPEDELKGFSVETDLDKALSHQPDAVVIANPTALHLDVAIPAAQIGCHILMEKPISHSLERVDLLQNMLEKGGGRLLVGFQYRFHPGLQRVKRLLEEQAIGKLLSLRVEWGEYLPGWHPWEDYRKGYSARSDLGGGVVLTLCHPLDYLRWLVGEVEELYASVGHLSDLEIDVEDSAEITLHFTGGSVASVHLDYYRRPGTHHMEMVGSKGMLIWDNADGSVKLYRAETAAWELFPATETFERNDLFLDEMRHFLEVTAGSAAPTCTLQDGKRALQLALAVHQSSREKRVLFGEDLYGRN
ncbi:MAG: Gfo/Idh/MocA family oxidoreductase [Anaerolineaceae bacterium]|nr:Gfo/Idh/MocA family oxidoreductase [Anaerolineaceae bacterium]